MPEKLTVVTSPPPLLETQVLSYVKLHPDVADLRRAYQKPAGIDIAAHLISESGRYNQMVLPPLNTRIIPTGYIVRPPPGYIVTVCSRSGLAAKAIFVANAPGIIDPDYTEELKVLLYNGGHQSVYIKHGDYIAQLVLFPVAFANLKAIDRTELPQTERGGKGFGSSG